MAVTQNLYTGDGLTVLFSFTFPYLETSDIKVSVDGTNTTAYTLANATTIQFNSAPANGAAIRIYRQTDDSDLSATFYPGSAIRSQDLNDNFTQNLYVTQEANNYGLKTDGSNPMVGDLDLDGNKVVNLATPTSSTDASTKGYVDSVIATGAANAAAAAASASASAASATAAATTLDSFDDRYLGAKTTDPTVDNDGNTLLIGAIYFNSTSKVMRVWNGANWQDSSANANVLRWRKTAVGGETTLSGNDDSSQSLTYTVNLEAVFLNGALLQRGVDYVATTGNSITGLVALTAGDVVEVLAFSQVSLLAIPSNTVTFTQTGTGAVQRTLESKLKDVVSVKDFGAVGDGVTDDTAAIQAAIATGSNVFFPEPDAFYLVSDRLDVITPGQTLYGVAPKSTEIRLVKPAGSNGHPLIWIKPVAEGAGVRGLHVNHNAETYIEPANWATATGDAIIWNSGIVVGANESFVRDCWVTKGHNCGVAVTSAADDINYQSTSGNPKRAVIDQLTTFECGVGFRAIDNSTGGPGWNVGSGSQVRVSNCVDFRSRHGGMVDLNAGAQAMITNCVAWYNTADPTTRKGGTGFYFAADKIIANNLKVYNPERLGVWIDGNARDCIFSNIEVTSSGYGNTTDPTDAKGLFIKSKNDTIVQGVHVSNVINGDAVFFETPTTSATGIVVDNLMVSAGSHANAIKVTQTGGDTFEAVITNALLSPGSVTTVDLEGAVTCQYRELGASNTTLDPGHSITLNAKQASTNVYGFKSDIDFDGTATAYSSVHFFSAPNFTRGSATGPVYAFYSNVPKETDTWAFYGSSRADSYHKGAVILSSSTNATDISTGVANGKQVQVDTYILRSSRNATTSQAHEEYYNPNGKVGQVRTLGSATQYHINGGGGVFLTGGSGTPEGVITASVGSLYMRTDGGAATSLYVKESGTGNTGWVAK